MENIIETTIKTLNRNPAAFLITVVGTVAQAIHTTKLAFDISPLTGNWVAVESILIGTFFSIGLVFFTVRAGLIPIFNDDTPEVKQSKLSEIGDYYRTAKYFAVFEAFINLFYWVGVIIVLPYFKGKQSTLTDVSAFDWFRFVSGCVYAVALPVILRKYAGEIKANSIDQTEAIHILEAIEKLRTELNNKEFEVIINGKKKYDVTPK